jgi:uncharacterized protein YuzE
MRLTYDRVADAVYILLRDVPCAYGYSLDESRRIDYGPDRRPRGVELLDVSQGVDVRGLPDPDRIAAALQEHGIRVIAVAS